MDTAAILRQRAKAEMVINLVEAKAWVFALELEVQQLREALKRTGVGFKPPP
jgi:hypothetical protein